MIISTMRSSTQTLMVIQGWTHWNEIQLGAEKEYGMSKAEFERLLPEYQKFMGLIALGYSGLGMFSSEVDKIWHTHILNTVLYEQFCLTICGRMIHHVPNLEKITAYNISDCLEPGPSCKEPDPDPSCVEPAPSPSCAEAGTNPSNQAYTAEYFRKAYTSIYGQIPCAIWRLTMCDGTAFRSS